MQQLELISLEQNPGTMIIKGCHDLSIESSKVN